MNILKDQIVNSINGETLTQHVGLLVSMKKKRQKSNLKLLLPSQKRSTLMLPARWKMMQRGKNPVFTSQN